MNKLFLVTPNKIMNGYIYPWFAWGASLAEVQATFEGCTVEEQS